MNLRSITLNRLLLLGFAVLFLVCAALFDGLVALTIVLIVVLVLGTVIAVVLPFSFGELFGDSFPSPGEASPTPSESKRQFSLRTLFVGMALAAVGWRLLPDMLPRLPEALSALAVLLGVLLLAGIVVLVAVTLVLTVFAWSVGVVVMLSSIVQRITFGLRHVLRSDKG